MANKQHAQFSDENGNIYYLENQTEDVLDPSGKPLSDGGDLSEASVTFTADSTRTLPKSGSRFKAFCGSVLKFLSDLKTVSFSGSYNDLSNKPSIPSGAAASQAVANNCTTTAAGSVLDARQGKVLMDKANQLNSELTANDTKFYFDYKDGQWGFNTDPARGADTFHPFDGDWTLSFLLSCGATANVNGEIVSPSGSGTVTIKCSNRAISQTSGTTVRGGGGHPVHSNECHASVSNFQLSYS